MKRSSSCLPVLKDPGSCCPVKVDQPAFNCMQNNDVVLPVLKQSKRSDSLFPDVSSQFITPENAQVLAQHGWTTHLTWCFPAASWLLPATQAF